MKLVLLFGIASMSVGNLMSQASPRSEIVFPFFVTGVTEVNIALSEGFQTELTFVNPDLQTARTTVEFISENGAPLQIALEQDSKDIPNPFDIPPQASIAVHARLRNTISNGWIRIQSSRPVSVLENVSQITRFSSPTGVIPVTQVKATVAIPSAEPVTEFVLSVVEDDTWGSGLAIVNPGEGTAEGVLTLVDATGKEGSSVRLSIGSRSQMKKLTVDIFSEFRTLKSGTIVGKFDKNVIAVSIRFHKGSNLFSLNLISKRVGT